MIALVHHELPILAKNGMTLLSLSIPSLVVLYGFGLLA